MTLLSSFLLLALHICSLFLYISSYFMALCWQGKLLPTPETVPFRLTRDIVDGMGMAGVDGIFRFGHAPALYHDS